MESQFGAVFGLAIDLVLLWALRSVRVSDQAGGDERALLPPDSKPRVSVREAPSRGPRRVATSRVEVLRTRLAKPSRI